MPKGFHFFLLVDAFLYFAISIYFVQVDLVKVEPLADEDHDGPAQLVPSALVKAADARHFRQVFRSAPAE